MKNILILFFIFSSAGIYGQAEVIFSKANDAYKAEDYSQATILYDSLVQMGYHSAPLYYNLANSYYKNDHLAEAILYYERAAKLAPNDEDIQHNLSVAREKTLDKFEELPAPLFRTAYLAIIRWLSPSEWAWFSIICFGFLTVGTGVYLFSSKRRFGFALAISGLITGALSLGFAYAHASYNENNKAAVVMAVSSYIKSAPSKNAADVFILHQGTKATITDELEGWKKIRLSDGKIGWIEASDLEEI